MSRSKVYMSGALTYLAKSCSLHQVKRFKQITVLEIKDRLAGAQERFDVLYAEKLFQQIRRCKLAMKLFHSQQKHGIT